MEIIIPAIFVFAFILLVVNVTAGSRVREWWRNNFLPITAHEVSVVSKRLHQNYRGYYWHYITFEFIASGDKKEFNIPLLHVIIYNDVTTGELGILKLRGTRFIGYKKL